MICVFRKFNSKQDVVARDNFTSFPETYLDFSCREETKSNTIPSDVRLNGQN